MTSRFGNLIGPAAAAVVIRVFDDELRYVFLLNGASKVLVFFLLVYLAKETAPEISRARRAGEEKLAKLDLSFFLTRGFFALFITTLSLNMMGGGGAFGALFPVQAKEEVGLSSANVGELLSLAGVMGMIVTFPNGWAVDRFGRKVTLIPGLGLLAAGAVVLMSLNDMTQVYIVVVLYGVGSAMSMGASQAFAADLAPPDRRGAFLGVWTTIGSVGSIVAPLLIGAVASNFGYAPGYLMVACFLGVSALFMAVFGPETRARRERSAAVAAPAQPVAKGGGVDGA
jgi:MFS family permease